LIDIITQISSENEENHRNAGKMRLQQMQKIG